MMNHINRIGMVALVFFLSTSCVSAQSVGAVREALNQKVADLSREGGYARAVKRGCRTESAPLSLASGG